MSDLRTLLINAIYEHSSEELDITDMMDIAKSSEGHLLMRLINILDWYANAYNNNQRRL
jgi:hypothetical protein